MRTLRRIFLGAVAMSAPAVLAMPAKAAGASDPRVTVLEQQLRDVQRQLAEIRRRQTAPATTPPVTATQLADAQRANAQQYAALKKRMDEQPHLGFGNGRLSIASRDGAFNLSLRSLVQFDAGYFSQGRGPAGVDLNSGTNFRRAQISLVGTAWKDWSYNFTYDFGGNGVEKNGYIYTASLQYNFAPFAVRLGAFAPPAGLDDSTSASNLVFLEWSSPADIARNIGGAPSREGFNVYAQGERYLASVAITGTKATDASHFDEQIALVSRAAYLAVDRDNMKWLLDADLTHVFKMSDAAAGPNSPSMLRLADGPEVAIDSYRTVDTGAFPADTLTEWGLETAVQSGRFYAQGGYFHFAVGRNSTLPDPEFSGWYAQTAFSLTGEPRRYDAAVASFAGPTPAHPLGRDGFGAWEIAARYSVIDLAFDPFAGPAAGGVAGGRQSIMTAALNWYPTAGLRFMLDYENMQVNHVEARSKDLSANIGILRSQIAL